MWKSIAGYLGIYEVSDSGEVRSLNRFIDNNGGRQLLKGKMLKQANQTLGYLQVSLAKSGVTKIRLVHQLVLETFIGPRPDGCVTCHGDNDRQNNSLDNLKWGTQSENLFDRIKHGTATRGEKHWNARLTFDQVENIRERQGMDSASVLGSEYNVHVNTVYRIWNRLRWKGEEQ